MRKYVSRIIPVFLIVWSIGILLPAMAAAQPGQGSKPTQSAAADDQTGYLENVLFQKMPGRERVSLIISREAEASVSRNADGSLLVRMENMFVPDSLRRSLGEGQLANVVSVVPRQVSADGRQWAQLTIGLKQSVPYFVRYEGKSVLIDFNVAAIVSAASPKPTAQGARDSRPARGDSPRSQSDRLISLDFQEAEIKSVLRLLAEYGNVSIISGEDVKGTVTMSMKNIPWSQALESILNVYSLTSSQEGNVITVVTIERKKKDEEERMKAMEAQAKAEEQRKARETELKAEQGMLRQVLIEAKIVEATESFIRNLGVTWGFGSHRSIGSYGLGLSGGSNTLQGNARGVSYPSEIPWTQAGTSNPLYMAAVNLPAALANPTLGLVFGGAQGFIETQLSALESTETGRVISSPKVVTMDNVKAVIKQGDEVPYITPASGTSPATVTFKEAVLRLEVLPKITEDGRISMEIKATNDTPDYARGERLQGNPPIRKNEVESKIVVFDGDTVVIGGVSRNQEDNIVAGIPWFQKIPVLGWLFKTENINRERRQLMIFITPKILTEAGYIEPTTE